MAMWFDLENRNIMTTICLLKYKVVQIFKHSCFEHDLIL